MDAVILAAGRGKRLAPLTDYKPKAMVEILGKPIMEWIYDNLIQLDINKIFIVSGYRQGVLMDYAKKKGWNVDFYTQYEQTGTADALYKVKNYVSDNFLVLAGDAILHKDDMEYLSRIKNSLLHTKMDRRLYEYGTLDIVGNLIRHINEKSTRPTSRLVNCSAYHFTDDVFNYIPKTPIDERFGERIITNTINLMIDDGVKFKGIPVREHLEISYPEDIKRVEKRLNE